MAEPENTGIHSLAGTLSREAWEALDQAIRENRRGSQMSELAQEYPEVHFAYAGLGDPWVNVFGAFRDDPLFDEWQEAIRENRRQREAEERAAEDVAAGIMRAA
jgi:hypothetical protein